MGVMDGLLVDRLETLSLETLPSVRPTGLPLVWPTRKSARGVRVPVRGSPLRPRVPSGTRQKPMLPSDEHRSHTCHGVAAWPGRERSQRDVATPAIRPLCCVGSVAAPALLESYAPLL